MAKRKEKSVKDVQPLDNLDQINLNAAGLDIGAEEIYACVPGRSGRAVGASLSHIHGRSECSG